MLIRTLSLIAALGFAAQTMGVETKEHTFEGRHFLVSTVDLEKESLQLFLGDGRGHYFNKCENIDHWLAKRKRRLVFGMNAGITVGRYGNSISTTAEVKARLLGPQE